MPSEILLVYCTCPDATTAAGIANELVDQGLAACVNQLPGITSTYLWQGVREQASEHLLLIKSSADRYPALEQAILASHPYELPEIIAVSVSRGLPDYLHWVDRCTR
ncbi:MAG: divalent-cation tolerance protein CutA [Gammaproteobacteria bacterium]|nr:divalent-cation tolerance protein CutA [Gammaproteobacteria bacterium]